MISPARVAAYDILCSVSAGRADLPSAIAYTRSSLADDRDRALAAEISAGVQRWRAALDYLIVTFAKRKLDHLDPEVVEILRLSAYQLLYLTRVPAAAVVDDAVNLAGKAGKRSASGFVNAVLRTVSRSRKALPLPPRPDKTDDRDAALEYFSITLSHPRWLAARWYDRLGFDAAEAWMKFNNTSAPVTLRVNRLKASVEQLEARLRKRDVTVRPGEFAPGALIVESGYPLRESINTAEPGNAGNPGNNDGLFVVQDEASQLVSLLAGAAPGPRVLDACASPGGKATAIASSLGANGRLVACDLRDRRIDLLQRTVRASGATNIWMVQADLLASLPFTPVFDCVVVDAPCSGLGTLRRDPDIRWRRTEADLATLADAQRKMLRHAAQVVAPGGRLVYATCSSEPEENEDVAAAFLAESPAFREFDARRAHPLLPESVVDAKGHLRTAPDHHHLESFFGAVFVRSA
jgi:16S rRNA (cytosine967-C5)-methyltransferase